MALFENEIDGFIREQRLPFPRSDPVLLSDDGEVIKPAVYANHDEVFAWWKNNGPRYPILSPFARKYLTIAVSSVLSERCFSRASLLFSNKLRTSLSKKTAAELILVNTYLSNQFLDKSEKEQWSDEESENSSEE